MKLMESFRNRAFLAKIMERKEKIDVFSHLVKTGKSQSLLSSPNTS